MTQGNPFVKNGITLLSGVDPVRRAERMADAVPIKDRTLYLCPSPLYGYGLSKRLSRLEKEAPNSAVLCVEADAGLYDLSIKNFEISFSGKLRITNIHDNEGLCIFVRETWGARAFKSLEVVRLTGGWQLFPEVYDSLAEALRGEIATDWSNALTLTRMGRLYIRNALRNLPMLKSFPSVDTLSFGGSAVLVLGAGPSLDETLDAIGKRFSKDSLCGNRPFKIICVDTCLGSLKDRGIVPDLAVILESQHWNLRDFTGCNKWEVPFAADLSALPQSLDMLASQGYFFMTPWIELAFFKRLKGAGLLPAVIPPLGSVGLTAMEIARRLTSGKIICAGLDFSFTYDKYHGRGTPGHRRMLNTKTRFKSLVNTAVFEASSLEALSKSGETVRSSPILKKYRDLFQREFASDSRLYDITGSGLPLGLGTLSLDEALDLLEKEIHAETRRRGGRGEDQGAGNSEQIAVSERLGIFVIEERKRLIELRGILTSEITWDWERLKRLIDECDYLWAHFPDYAGGKRPEFIEGSQETLSFLKRLRFEIDPALILFERSL
jgi:hypothetical protein